MKSAAYFSSYTGIPRHNYINIFLVLIQSIAIGICYFLSLYFVNTLELPVKSSGVMLSCYGLGTIIGGIAGGHLADTLPARFVSFACLILQAICFLFLAIYHNQLFIMFILFILGLSFYSFRTSNDLAMLESCLNDSVLRQKLVNISRVAMNLGLGISGVIIGSLAIYGFEYIFYFFSIMLTITAIVLHKSTHLNTSTPNRHKVNEDSYESATANSSPLILTLICLFYVGLMIAQLGATYPLYIMYLFPALGMKAVSILYLLDTFLIILTQAQIGHALRNSNKILVMGCGALLMGLGMAMLNISYMFSIAILSCITWTVGEMLFMPFAQLVCYENGGAKKKGQALGLYQTVYAASIVIGPTAGSYIYQYSPPLLWGLCGILGAFCLIMCVYIPQIHPNTATQEG